VNDTGLPGVTLDDREHVCVFHRGPEERDAVLAAFFGAGLAAGDKCLCIADTGDTGTSTGGTGTGAMADRLDPDHRRTLPDQLTVLPATAYLTDGRFVPRNVYAQWHSIIGAYVGEGYRHVRGTGELSWFLRRHRPGDDAAPLLEYEALCNRLVQRRPATIFCLYDLDLLDAGLLPGVLRHHPAALAGGVLFRGPWPIDERPGGADEALLLANQLLAGARHGREIDDLVDGIRGAVLEGDNGPEGQRFLRALAGIAAPHRRVVDADVAGLARRLLDGGPIDGGDEAALRRLGLDLDAPLRTVVARPAIDPKPLADQGIRLVATVSGEAAFVVAADTDLDAFPAGDGRTVGVGRAHTGVAGAVRSYAEARRAADFAARLDRPVLRHEDLGLFGLLAEGGDPGPMADLVAEWLGPLLAHDEGRRQTLLPTLAAYLDAGAAQQATADGLGIHVSTLKYRLGRIGAVTGRDLSRPDVRFQLQVALTAHRTLSVLQTQEG
jgi:hypothetical protein